MAKKYIISNIRLTNFQDNCDDFVTDFIVKKNFENVIYITTKENRQNLLNKMNIDAAEGVIIDSFTKDNSIDDLISFINESIPYDEDIFVDANVFNKTILFQNILYMVRKLNEMNVKENVRVMVGVM